MKRPTVTPSEPVLTIIQPAPNLVVGLNTPFQITGQVTDRGLPEPIEIESVTVQVDGQPPIRASLKQLPNKTLSQYTFSATAQIASGNGPHTITVVATNDQPQSTTKAVTVVVDGIAPVDGPAILVDLLTLIPLDPNDAQVLGLLGKIQTQLIPLSQSLATVNKVLIGPNLLAQPINSAETRLRLGFWIEDQNFPVVPPSAGFPLPRLSDAAANAALTAAPLLAVPSPGLFPSYGISIPVTTLQHFVDAAQPAIAEAAAAQGLTIESFTVQTSASNIIETAISGHVTLDVPLSLTITETVGFKAVVDATSPQMAPAVLSTSTSSSLGSFVDWLVGVLFPLIGATLAYAFYKLSAAASNESGLAGSLLGSIPARIPFGNKAFALPANPLYQLPDFPALVFYWNSFEVTSAGLVGNGVTSIEARTESIVKLTIAGPTSFRGTQENIQEFTDPVLSYALENISPDIGKFDWQVTGYPNSDGSISLPSPLAPEGDFNPHFPLPAKIQATTYNFNIAVKAVETCESDPTKTLTGTASRAVTYQVVKLPILTSQ